MYDHANFEVLSTPSPWEQIVIRDLGPWNIFPTVTNDVLWVVARLHRPYGLGPARRLFYFDSEGQFDEILHDGEGHFVAFKHAGPEELDRIDPERLFH